MVSGWHFPFNHPLGIILCARGPLAPKPAARWCLDPRTRFHSHTSQGFGTLRFPIQLAPAPYQLPTRGSEIMLRGEPTSYKREINGSSYITY